ncbi:MAG TPA: Rv2175c family DNA-binding protein [Nocardioidaceae bacterium]|nr:Rv2175c family DNA-binding protein [Nocardioidaceae bacterium]
MSDNATITDALIDDWLSQEDVAKRLGVPTSKVRQLARDHQLVMLPKGRVPALFLDDNGLVKGLPGTLTLLADAGYDDTEAMRWLFTADESLPGRPIDALRANRGTEVRRRAQALGF